MREAVWPARNTPGPSTITFGGSVFTDSTPDTITLTPGYLALHETGAANQTTILGPDSAPLTISGNHATRIFKVGTGAHVNLSGLTLVDEQPGEDDDVLLLGTVVVMGGSILNYGTLSVSATTISGNIGGNAAISSVTGDVNDVTVINSTITNNTAPVQSAVINDMIMHNSIVAGNIGASMGGQLFPASSFNLIGTGYAGGLINGVNGNVVGVADPLLGPLQSNGGPTLTHAPLTGSPALNAGSSALAAAANLSHDQRGNGYGRIFGTVDIGAVEVQPPNHGPTDLSLSLSLSLSLR